jgi:hypothetical protein
MGVVASIGFDRFPKQGTWLGKKVRVCFNYDAGKQIGGVIVREDAEDPGLTIIALDDGRYVLTTECMFSLARETDTPTVKEN